MSHSSGIRNAVMLSRRRVGSGRSAADKRGSGFGKSAEFMSAPQAEF